MKSSTALTDQKIRRRKSLGPLLLGLLLVGGLAIIVIPLYLAFSNMMDGGPAPQTPQQLALSKSGSQVKIVVKVTGMPSQTRLTGDLLKKNSDGTYSQTGQMVSIKWNPSQAVSMGSSSDVKIGAILQISGKIEATDVLMANQLVILTNVVHLK
jgi:hypothetical protein